MADKWMQLGEFLKAHLKLPRAPGDPQPPAAVILPADRDVAQTCEFPTAKLLAGDIDLSCLRTRADPVGDLLAAIADAFKIDPYLLDPYAAFDVAGPVVLPPPEDAPDQSRAYVKRDTTQGACYRSPRMHLAGSRLYPVCLTLERDPAAATPAHCHPGTELVVALDGSAEVAVKAANGQRSHVEVSAEDFSEHRESVYPRGLLHFRSKCQHVFIRRGSGRFRAWVFRELASPPSTSRWAVLGRQLQSWRHYQKRSLQETADRVPPPPPEETADQAAAPGGLSFDQLDELEDNAVSPFPDDAARPSLDQLKLIAKHYEIGPELLITFAKPDASNDMVRQSAVELANRRADECEELGGPHFPGVRYNWPDQILGESTVRPGLLTIAPFSHSPPHHHPGSEIVLVIRGRAEIRFPDSGTSVGTITAGQLAHFDSTCRHTVINVGRQFLFAWVLREITFGR